ncbi:hypothetical protein LCGC14_1492140 [marine sediment metagenome]|uniref:Portal protein n=1 Tax=marine sediment metagenome TaxID=412755 RepID=A0A0F9M865_9ZZZZ
MATKSKRTIKVPKGSKIQVIVSEGDTPDKLGGDSIFAEAGVSGLKRWGGVITDEFLPELRGRRGARIYTEMASNDGSIGAVIRATEDLIRSVGWNVELGGSTAEDELSRDFLVSCMHDMSLSWVDFISSVVTMIQYGWAWEEVVYKLRTGPNSTPPSKYKDQRIGWRKIADRAQDSLLEWDLDDNGGIRAMVQQTATDLKERRIPIEKSVLYRTRRNRNNPEGYSFLRPSYLAWYMKKSLQELEGIGAERDFTGALIIKLPKHATNADKNKALALIERWKIDEQFGCVVPDGWEVTLIASPGSKQIDTDKAILRYQAEIMMSFLAQFIRLGQVKVGTQALVVGQRDFFYLAIKAILDNIQETSNRFLIPPLIRLNDFRGLTDFPRLVHDEVGQTDIDTFIKALHDIATSNVDYLGNVGSEDVKHIRKIVGLPPLQEEQAEENDDEDEQSKDKREKEEKPEEKEKPQVKVRANGARSEAERKVAN